MAEYLDPPIAADASDIEERIYEYIQFWFPGFSPKEPALATILTEGFASETSDLTTQASAIPSMIFMHLAELFDAAPITAKPAVAQTTWVMKDDAGYTVPEGTVVTFQVGPDDYRAFETIADFSVLPGFTSTVAGEIAVVAQNEGADSNGITSNPTLLDGQVSFVDSVSIVGSTANGKDAEDPDDFRSRFKERLELLADRPVLAKDFAKYTEVFVPEVAHAVGIDNYNPADGSYNNEKMVAVAIRGADGVSLSSDVKATVKALLESVREWNFIANAIDFTYNPVTIAVTVHGNSDQVPADLSVRVTGALTQYLDPVQYTGADGKIRLFEIAQVINSVDGVNYIENGTLLINTAADDLTMTGAAPLPAVSPTITVTVVIP